MPDRSVKIVVGADVSPLKRAMADGAKSVDGLGTSATTLGQKIKSGLAFAGVTGGVVSLGAAIKSTFTLGLDFTSQMNTLQAVSGATGKTMEQVAAHARELGNDITIPATSAADAAEAMTELAKGGLSVQQAMDAAKGTLQLAAAASISGAQAATIQANALNVFHLRATDAGHVADVLANTANAANGEITDFAQAMQQAGGVASGFGWTLDETATMLGLLAKNGMIGSDAGTSLKASFLQLATPSKQAKDAIEKLGLQVYDSNGKFISARDLTAQLSAAQKRMSDQAFQSAAGILFGSDAIRTVINVSREGAAGYDEMGKKIEKVGGVVDLATAKMKGLPGALQNLRNAADNVALGLYNTLAPAVQTVVNDLADVTNTVGPAVVSTFGTVTHVIGVLADGFGALPGPVKAFAVALAAVAIADKIGLLGRLTSAASGVGAAFASLGPLMARIGDDAALAGVSRMRVGLGLVGGAAKSAGVAVMGAFGGPVGLAIAGAAAGIALLVKKWQDAQPVVRDFTAAVDASTGALADNAAQAAASVISNDLVQWDKLGGDVAVYTAAVLGNAGAQHKMQTEISDVAARLAQQAGVYSDNAAAFQQAGITQQEVMNAVRQGVLGNDDAWGTLVDRMHSAQVPFGDVNRANTEILETFGKLQPVIDQYQSNVKGLNNDLVKAQVEHKATAGATDTMSDSWSRASGAMSAAGSVAAATASDVDGLSSAVAGQVSTLQALLAVASQTRSAISSATTGFVSPVGAYQAATQKANAKPSGGGGGGGGGSRTDPLVTAATALVDQAKKDRDAIDRRYTDILDVTKARYDEQLTAWEKARDAVKAAADEAQRSAEAFLANSQDRASAAKDEASALSDLAGFGAQGSTLATALETQAVAQAKLNVAKDEQVKIEGQLKKVSDPKQRAELQDRLNTLVAQQSSLQAVAAAADKDAADARAELAKNTDLSTGAAQRALDAMQKQATAAAEVIGKDKEAADTAETSAARKTKADDTFTANKTKNDDALKALQAKADAANQKATDKYNSLLDAKNAAEERSKTSSASHGSGVSGAASKMAADAKPSFAQYESELRNQVNAQERWKNNIISLASRVGPDVATELAKMGPEAAPMIEMLANQTDTTLNTKWVPLFKKSTAQGTQDIQDELTKALDPTGEKGLQLGNKVIDKLQEALKAAKDDPAAKAAILAVIGALQTTATKNPVTVKVNPDVDLAKLNQSMANAFGAGYNPATFWGQGSAANRAPGLKNGGWIPGAASGEWITGGTPGQDSVLRWLMPGEAVIPTANAQANRPIVDALMRGQTIPASSHTSSSQTVIYETIYYPQAEPAAATRKRTLDTAAAIGVAA